MCVVAPCATACRSYTCETGWVGCRPSLGPDRSSITTVSYFSRRNCTKSLWRCAPRVRSLLYQYTWRNAFNDADAAVEGFKRDDRSKETSPVSSIYSRGVVFLFVMWDLRCFTWLPQIMAPSRTKYHWWKKIEKFSWILSSYDVIYPSSWHRVSHSTPPRC
jgi:hypothetical protein